MQEADHVLIPLLNGAYGVAQIARVADARAVMHITDRVVTQTATTTPIAADDVCAIVLCDIGALDDGHWPVAGYEAIVRLPLPAQDATPQAPAVIEAFANAVHGLYPWDGFPDPDFFTAMLRAPDEIPPQARWTKDMPKPDAT